MPQQLPAQNIIWKKTNSKNGDGTIRTQPHRRKKYPTLSSMRWCAGSVYVVQVQPRNHVLDRSCRLYGSHPATWGRSHIISIRDVSALPGRSASSSRNRWSVRCVKQCAPKMHVRFFMCSSISSWPRIILGDLFALSALPAQEWRTETGKPYVQNSATKTQQRTSYPSKSKSKQ